jgi:hypothetical protein
MTKQFSNLLFFLIINQKFLDCAFPTFIVKEQSQFGTTSTKDVTVGNADYNTYINGQSVFINEIALDASGTIICDTLTCDDLISNNTATIAGDVYIGGTNSGNSKLYINASTGDLVTLGTITATGNIATLGTITVNGALVATQPWINTEITNYTNFGTNAPSSIIIGRKATGINTNIRGDAISLNPNVFSLSTYTNPSTFMNPTTTGEIYLNSNALSSGTIFGVGTYNILGTRNKADAFLKIDYTGKIGIVAVTSSRNFKHNIQDASVLINNTNLLDQINPVTFSYNDKSFGSNETYAGLIAEDLVGTPFEFAILKTDEGTIYGIDYNSIFSCMIQFIKYQKQQIDQQQSAINQILTRIATLENK